ncbi:MAG: ATP-binding protein [Candidatus Helarchaeota archaeon]
MLTTGSLKFLKNKVIEIQNHAIRSFAMIFNNKNYRRGLTILEIVQISNNMITRENREKPRILDRLITPGQKQYIFYHLLPIADEIQQISYEIAISKYQIKLRLYITHSGNLIEEELINILREKSDLVEASFKATFKDIEFKNLVGNELYDAWSEIFEYGNYIFKIIDKNVIEINRTTNNIYLSILYLDSITPTTADQTLTQIDQLINNILSQNLEVHYLSVIQPSLKYNFSVNTYMESQQSNFMGLSKESYNNRLDEKLHNQLLNMRHSEYIQMWNCSTYIVLKAYDKEKLKRNLQKTKAIFKNVFSDSNIIGSVRILERKNLESALSKIIMRDKINDVKMSSEQLISTFHLPESIVPSLNMKTDIPIFEIPPKLDKLDKRKIRIGSVLHGHQSLYDIYVDLEELRLNMFIVGQVGMGKTEFTKNFLKELYKVEPNVNWLVLEWKGDYKNLVTGINEPIQIIKAGSDENPLKINIFDPIRANPENHAMKLFSIFKEVLKSSYKSHINTGNYELSPQMEKITRKILLECVRNPIKRNFKAFFNELKNYENKFYKNRNSSISMSVLAIENRFQRFISGVLGKIMNVDKSNINFTNILNRKIIFDLSSVIYRQGTKEDVRILMNLILKYVIDQALKQGPTNRLKHIVILEDSQLLVPEILREVPETTLGEDIPLLLRSVGEAMISIATRPRISSDIISNSAIKVTFKLNQADDTLKVAKYQNLNEEQEQYLRFLNKQEAIISTLNFPYPFRIKTITSYPKNVSDVDVMKHNLKYFPEMYQKNDEYLEIDNSKAKIKNDENKNQYNKIDKFTEFENFNENLSNWEQKCLQNLSEEYKKIYLQLRKIIINPKTKDEISNVLNIDIWNLSKYLNKFISLKLINYDFFPDFYSDISIKRFHLNDNKNYIKMMIDYKLKKDFYNPGIFQKSDIELFDYLICKNKIYLKIFTNKINQTNKKYFKALFLQWEEKIIKNNKNALIIIVPFGSSIDSINKLLKEPPKISIITIAYNAKQWEKLKEFIDKKSVSDKIQDKKAVSKNINTLLEDIEDLNISELTEKFSFLNLDGKKINNREDFFSFIAEFQKKIKNNLDN